MKLAPYVKKLKNSEHYKEFRKKYDDAYLFAGFFVLDLENRQEMHQLDFYVPSEKKVAAFTLAKKAEPQLLSLLNSKVPEQLDASSSIDLDALYGILEDEMKNRSISDDIKKIIAVLQVIDGKKVWNLNCVLSGMGILRAHVDDESKTILKMEKVSLLDVMKKISPEQLQKLQQGAQAPAAGAEGDAKEQLKKLEEMEEAIKKEKAQLENAQKEDKKGK